MIDIEIYREKNKHMIIEKNSTILDFKYNS